MGFESQIWELPCKGDLCEGRGESQHEIEVGWGGEGCKGRKGPLVAEGFFDPVCTGCEKEQLFPLVTHSIPIFVMSDITVLCLSRYYPSIPILKA